MSKRLPDLNALVTSEEPRTPQKPTTSTPTEIGYERTPRGYRAADGRVYERVSLYLTPTQKDRLKTMAVRHQSVSKYVAESLKLGD